MTQIWLMNPLLLVGHNLNVLRCIARKYLLLLLLLHHGFLATGLALLLCLLQLLTRNLLRCVLVQLLDFEVVGWIIGATD